MGVLGQKKIHAGLALTLVICTGLFVVFLSFTLINNVHAKMDLLTEKKQRIATLGARHKNAFKNLTQYRNQLGMVGADNKTSAIIVEQDLEMLRQVFADKGITLTEGAASVEASHTKIELSAYGDSATLLEVFSSIMTLTSKLSDFSLQAIDPADLDSPSMISFTLIYYSGDEEKTDD